MRPGGPTGTSTEYEYQKVFVLFQKKSISKYFEYNSAVKALLLSTQRPTFVALVLVPSLSRRIPSDTPDDLVGAAAEDDRGIPSGPQEAGSVALPHGCEAMVTALLRIRSVGIGSVCVFREGTASRQPMIDMPTISIQETVMVKIIIVTLVLIARLTLCLLTKRVWYWVNLRISNCEVSAASDILSMRDSMMSSPWEETDRPPSPPSAPSVPGPRAPFVVPVLASPRGPWLRPRPWVEKPGNVGK
ncbi:hypothetical protein BJX99DRAFT_254870 [Aspergillus californicus]